ncbi:hypothetical protein [Luteithermobacter gelatinilyticus]|uniref:hypothetical protein n=1 Tax=Luteithermobacter gelatinilyticus TaxID=2582913 RepID=UPI001105D81D|nr:hypothetical protein [Luteithermobacter gelatinilyticus]
MNRLTHSAGQVWFRSQGFGAGHTGGTAQPNPAGTGPNRPGPALRVGGLGPLTLSDAWPDAPHRPAPSSA